MVTIGVFDSGLGGLSVARQIIKRLPEAQIIYYGDTARVPYGEKSRAELIYLADIVTDYLLKEGAQIIIDACNSTSAVALDYLKEKYHKPTMGVIEPGAKAAYTSTKNGRIGLIGTEATVKSGVHAELLKSYDSKIKLVGQPCPGFVPLIEKGEIASPQISDLAVEYLEPLKEAGIDTLILGCTHYPFLEPVIKKIMGPEVTLIDPAIATTTELEELLKNNGKTKGQVSTHRFVVSGDPEHFKKVANSLPIGIKIAQVEKVYLK